MCCSDQGKRARSRTQDPKKQAELLARATAVLWSWPSGKTRARESGLCAGRDKKQAATPPFSRRHACVQTRVSAVFMPGARNGGMGVLLFLGDGKLAKPGSVPVARPRQRRDEPVCRFAECRGRGFRCSQEGEGDPGRSERARHNRAARQEAILPRVRVRLTRSSQSALRLLSRRRPRGSLRDIPRESTGAPYATRPSARRRRFECCLALHRALRRMAGLVFLLVFWVLAGACQRHGVGVFLLRNTTTTKPLH